jgi:hypothetical protein
VRPASGHKAKALSAEQGMPPQRKRPAIRRPLQE